MMTHVPEPVAIQRTAGFILLDDDTTVQVHTWFDAHGDETDDAEEAFACVAQLRDGRWLTVDLTAFETVAEH